MADPVRTCLGCRERAAKGALLRLVWSESDGPRPDPRQTAPGRGAYLHRQSECLESALRRRAFGRAWRLEPGRPVDPDRLRAAVAAQLGPSAGSAQEPTSR